MIVVVVVVVVVTYSIHIYLSTIYIIMYILYVLYTYIPVDTVDISQVWSQYLHETATWRSIGTKLKYVMLPRARADKGAGLRERPGADDGFDDGNFLGFLLGLLMFHGILRWFQHRCCDKADNQATIWRGFCHQFLVMLGHFLCYLYWACHIGLTPAKLIKF